MRASCIVSAGSVLRGEFPAFSRIAGNPATVVGDSRDGDARWLDAQPALRAHYDAWAAVADRLRRALEQLPEVEAGKAAWVALLPVSQALRPMKLKAQRGVGLWDVAGPLLRVGGLAGVLAFQQLDHVEAGG